jgi:hypothetical protein
LVKVTFGTGCFPFAHSILYSFSHPAFLHTEGAIFSFGTEEIGIKQDFGFMALLEDACLGQLRGKLRGKQPGQRAARITQTQLRSLLNTLWARSCSGGHIRVIVANIALNLS